MTDTRRGFQTIAVHAGHLEQGAPRPVAPSIHVSTTYRWADVDAGIAYSQADEPDTFYRRHGTPNATALETRLAALEGAERALLTGSGMSAQVLAVMTALPDGGHVVCARTVYGETSTFLRTVAPRMGITTTFADDVTTESFLHAMRDDTRAVLVECPANPTLDLVDLVALAGACRARGVLTLCDATLATPYNCRPLALGIDVVTHSATKYLSGHSDAMGGVLAGHHGFVGRAWTLHRVMGAASSPFDAWLIERGVRTLGLRMEQHNRNAEVLAAWLEAHPAVLRVAYPSLASHPAHAWAKTQHRGFGGLMGLSLRGGVEAARTFVGRLKLFALATSLGGVESLVQFPASMARLSAEDRARLGIPASLIRLAVGCEHVDDLRDDLAAALDGL